MSNRTSARSVGDAEDGGHAESSSASHRSVDMGVHIMMQTAYDACVRTTIDLPDDVHRVARAIAHDQGRTLSDTVAMLLRRALGQGGSSEVVHDATTGLPSVRLGVTITSEDVRSLEDEL